MINIELITIFLLVAAAHIGVPFTYFLVMSKYATRTSYGLKLSNSVINYPKITILVPTYNEATVIRRKLENISEISYPKDKIQLLVVDGKSNDDTVEISRNVLKTIGISGGVIEESERKGKTFGMNIALKQASGELVCISDAECYWDTNALKNAVRYFSDPIIGSVSGVHEIISSTNNLSVNVEHSYRSIYRMLRIAESKIDSTPIAEGEIQVLRRDYFEGFDPNVGGDDTSAALRIVEKGFRAITAEDVVFYEPTPSNWKNRFTQKIRRGQHVLQAFLSHRRLLLSKNTVFSRIIFPMEFYLYILNPILFVPFIILFGLMLVSNIILTLFMGIIVVVSLIVNSTRNTLFTYLSNNLTMLAALFQELRGNKQLTWTKIEDTRIAPIK